MSASSKLVTRGTVDQDRCICSAIVFRIRDIRSTRTGPQLSCSPVAEGLTEEVVAAEADEGEGAVDV